MYEGIDLFERIKGKFGKRQYDPEKDKEMTDMTFVVKNGCIVIHSQEEVWFIKIEEKVDVVMPLKRVNFKTKQSQVTIFKILPCIDYDLLAIAFQK
jgi:hypothetical protein